MSAMRTDQVGERERHEKFLFLIIHKVVMNRKNYVCVIVAMQASKHVIVSPNLGILYIVGSKTWVSSLIHQIHHMYHDKIHPNPAEIISEWVGQI